MMPNQKTIEVALTRTIPASSEEVFDGWLDPKCPGTIWNVAQKLVRDVKVDGLYYWTSVNDAGDRKPHYGRFTVLDRPSKIQYTWMSPHTRGLESLLTVTFETQGEQTLLTLRHENLPDDDFGRKHEAGWNSLLSQFGGRFSHSRI
jgi:uncharacterized protein YndB with AHSA1/START domain